MATINIKTQGVDRVDLAAVFKNNRLMKAIENLVLDVTLTIPDAIEDQADAIAAAQAAANAAQVAANAAQSTATTALGAAGAAQADATAALSAAAAAQLLAFAVAQRSVPLALTDGPTIAVNASANWAFRVTLGGNRTLAAPSGLSDGALLHFAITQDATGGRGLTFASIYDFGAAGAPVLSTSAGAVDYVGGYYDAAAGKILCIFRPEEDASVARVSAHNNGSTQSVPSSTWTQITLGTDEYDVGAKFASSRWTPPAGPVQLCGTVAMAVADGSTLMASIYKNGAEYRRGAVIVSGAAGTAAAMVSCQDQANGTDYYELWSWQNTGSAQNTNGAAAQTWFQASSLCRIIRVSPPRGLAEPIEPPAAHPDLERVSMRNFLRIGTGINVAPLMLAISRQPGLWTEDTFLRHYPQGPFGEVDSIMLRFPVKQTGLSDEEIDLYKQNRLPGVDQHESIDYPAYSSLPDARNLIMGLFASVGGERLGRVMINRIAPGGRIFPHADTPAHAGYYSRFHVVLQSAEGVKFRAGDEVAYWETGAAFWFNNKLEHEIVNDSKVDRIHLIMDARCHRFGVPTECAR